MSNKITLDSLRESIEKKYVALEIELSDTESVKLRNPLRLDKAERTKLMELSKENSEESGEEKDEDAQLDTVREMIRLVADDKAMAAKLLKLVGDDAAMLMEIMDNYNKEQKPGEASASQN